MKPHLSVASVPLIERGFSKAILLLSGEKARLRRAPRIDSSRSGSLHAPEGFVRVALHRLLPSSDTQAERLPSGDSTAPTGRDEETGRIAARLCPHAPALAMRRNVIASLVFREELFEDRVLTRT